MPKPRFADNDRLGYYAGMRFRFTCPGCQNGSEISATSLMNLARAGLFNPFRFQETSPMHFAILPFLVTIFIANHALAWVSDDVGSKFIGPLNVITNNKTTGSCWSNEDIIKSLAISGLTEKGYLIASEIEKPYSFAFIISVDAQRNADFSCYGLIEIEIVNRLTMLNLEGDFVLGRSAAIFVADRKSGNQMVFDTVREFLYELPSE